MSGLSKALVRLDEWRHDNYSIRFEGVPAAVNVLRRTIAEQQVELQRLRAEREALHSDEMARKVHAAVVDAIRSKFLVNHRDGAINSMGLSETVAHAVVRVLRDDSEADQ